MFDEKYFARYSAIVLRTNCIEDFCGALPLSNFDGYEDTMNKLLNVIRREIETALGVLSQAKDASDIAFANQELGLLRQKEATIKARIETKKAEDAKEEEMISTPGKKNLIFLKSPVGNVFLEGDIKDFPEEYLTDLIDLIRRLKEYDMTFNTTTHRKFANNNGLKNAFEFKGYKVRLMYKHLEKDTVLVMGASFKNQDNPMKERETLTSRIKDSKKIISSVEEDLKDPVKKSKLIADNALIEAELIKQLEARSRGQK